MESACCRLCGSVCADGARIHSKTDQQVKTWITKAFDIDTSQDPPSHPQFICDCCRRKLCRWYKAIISKRKAVLNITLSDFTADDPPHAEDPPFDVHVGLFKAAEGEAQNHGLQKWVQPNGDVCFVSFNPSSMAVDRCVIICQNGTWKLIIHGKCQSPMLHKSLSKIPDILELEHIPTVFHVAVGPLCVGNPDFPSLMDREIRKGKDGAVQATVDLQGPYVFRGKEYASTIRKVSCTYLANEEGQCPVCRIYRTDLQASYSYTKNKSPSNTSRTDSSSHVTHTQMTTSELKQKLVNIQGERRNLKKHNMTLERQIEHLMVIEGVSVNGNNAQDIHNIVADQITTLDSLLQENTPQRILWESQKKAMSCAKGNARAMRWHPAVIRWCIALHSKSPAAYRAIRDSRFLILPHQNTLNDYVHYTELHSGFDADFILRLVSDFKLYEKEEHERHVTLAFDEMKIKCGLAYCPHSGKIHGFTELGTLNEELKQFERKCQGVTDPPLATHVLVLMVRGITSHLQKPLAYFPCQSGFNSHELYNTLNEAVELLEFVGFKVHCYVSDGASSNRKFYSMQRIASDDSSTIDDVTFATEHIIRPGDRMFFMCDTPHLMKTSRNNWENSGFNQKTRNMMYKGLPISWGHLVGVYKWDIGLDSYNPGLRMLHKLHHEHIHLKPSLRMRVYMAVQVLSGSVANAMEMKGDPEYKSTIQFVRMFNKFFDYLNVTNFSHGRDDLQPYRSPDDPRLQWLTDNFLNYLHDWQHESDGMDFLTKDQKKRLCLSQQTLEGLQITVHSFVSLTRNLLNEPGVTAILSEKFTQDPLEEHFSRQRAAGGGNDNPTVTEFRNNSLSIQVASEASRITCKSRRGNTRSKRSISDADLVNCSQLPKKKRAKSVLD